jgi:hypothetical protein
MVQAPGREQLAVQTDHKMWIGVQVAIRLMEDLQELAGVN